MDGKGQPMMYNAGAPQAVVVQSVPMTTVSAAPGQEWKWCTFVTSVISTFFCTCCGLPAFALALLAYTDHKGHDYPRRDSKLKKAFALALTSIILGAIMFIVVIIANIVVGRAAANAAHNSYYSG